MFPHSHASRKKHTLHIEIKKYKKYAYMREKNMVGTVGKVGMMLTNGSNKPFFHSHQSMKLWEYSGRNNKWISKMNSGRQQKN